MDLQKPEVVGFSSTRLARTGYARIHPDDPIHTQ